MAHYDIEYACPTHTHTSMKWCDQCKGANARRREWTRNRDHDNMRIQEDSNRIFGAHEQ